MTESATPTPTPTEAEESTLAETETESTSPSATALVKSMADTWGAMSETERVEICDSIEVAGTEYMWEALGSPDTITKAEVAVIWDGYCANY